MQVRSLGRPDLRWYVPLCPGVPPGTDNLIGKRRATPHDVLETYGHLIKGSSSTKLLLNGGLSKEEADKLIGEGKIDAAVFGRPWITNPDLQARFERAVEVNLNYDTKTFYGPGDGSANMRVGYSDFRKAT